MDNKGTYHLNDNKMDTNTVWKWRILHVKKYSRDPEPFHYSDEIGLDFNIACNTQKKLDLQLVTNGVILEVCDFAKTVSKNKRHFITNILENNFSLGLENEEQRSHFTAQILHKVNDLIRNPPEDKHEVFTLFDVSSKPGSTKNSNNVQKMLSTECKTEGFLVEMNDTDDSEHEDELDCSEATSNKYIKTESISDEMDRAHSGDSEECSGVQSKKELKDASFPHSFPHCIEIGLNLDVDSKQSLDPSLLTKGVMLEVVHFTRVLAASYSRIILDVLEHNFELDLKNQLVTNRVSSNISHLLKRRKQLTAIGSKITPEFKNEPFFFQTFARHHDKRGLCTSEEQIQTPQILPNKADMKQEEMGAESSYSCAPGKSDLDPYDGTDSRNTGNEDHSEHPESCSLSSDPPKSESSCLGLRDTFLVSTDVSSSLPTANSDVNSPFTSQSPQSVLNKCDMEQEEMITENYYTFPIGESDIDSDEGAGSQNTSNEDHLENPEMFSLSSEIPPFASQLDKKWLCRSGEQTQISRNAPNECDMEQEGCQNNPNLEPCSAGSSQPTIKDQNVGSSVDNEANLKLWKVRTNRIQQMPSPNKSVINSKKSHGSKRNLYPICKEIGLDLDMASQSEDKEKLDLKPLFASQSDSRGLCTAEAQTQTARIVPRECDVKQEEIKTENYYSCPIRESDIDSDAGADSQNTGNQDHFEHSESWSLSSDNYRQLESNCMDVEASILTTTDVLSPLPSVNSKPIFTYPPVEKGLNRSGEQTQIPRKAPNKCDMEQEGCQNNPNLEPCSADSSQATIKNQNIASYVANEHKNELNMKLWKVRTNRIQKILSVPHEEDCPLYSYSRCKKLGIDFNAGSGVKQNLDPKFLTYGIMVELNTFATALISSRKYFITEILEHNFNLDLKNELFRSAFAHKTMSNIVALSSHTKSCTGVRLKLPFELPDMRSIQEAIYKKTTYCPRCYQDQSHKLRQNESDTAHVNPSPDTMTDTVSADVSYTAKKPAKDPSSNFSATEEMIMNSNPHCKKIGLTLCVDKDQPKNKLDTHVLTRGIILEVANFAQKLCGTIHNIINDVLEHNFNITRQSPDLNPSQMFKAMLKTKHDGLTWLDEVFVIRQHSFRSPGYVGQMRAAALAVQRSDCRETIQKRKLALQTKRKRSTLPDPNKSVVKSNNNNGSKGNLYDEDSDKGTDSENTGNEDHSEHPESCSVSSDLPKSESSCLGMLDTFLTSTDVSSSLPTVNSDVNSPFTSQHDERGLCRGGEQTPSPQSVLNKWDTEQEEMGTEANMWKLRSNRVEQIVSPLNKEFAQFHISKRAGLEFNVGFGPKQNISVDSLTNSVLLEIVKFALAINSSQKEFIMEILEYNFDFGLQSPNQRNTFTREVMKRVRQLRCCEDAVKFSNEVFELPGPRPSINMANQSEGNVIPQLSSILKMEKCDVGFSSSADSHGESKEPIPHKSVDLYPFCKEIGLKLCVNNSQPNRKLEINVLTNGAMTEVTNFAEKLCGTFEEICLDILRHNFDLDQSGDSDAAKNILARIPVLVEQKNLSFYSADGRNKFKGGKSFDFKNNPNLDACSSPDPEHKKEINLKLWKVRTKQIQHILSMPHEEDCPLYSYSRCKKLGIDFNVGSGVKQNLDPKFLTNGIMAELNAFVVALLLSTKHFITEILEFNFNLDLKDELYRSAFTQEIVTKLRSIHSWKKDSETRWKIPFKLPDMSCIQEPSFDRTTYCPRCYQERNHKLGQDKSDAGHVNPCLQSMTDIVSADENYSTKKPAKDTSSTFSATEETIMNSHPHCKKIGLTLCVDKDQPTDKLDTHFLTRGVMLEVENFAKKLCGTRIKLLHDLLEHNFNISMQPTRVIDFGKMHLRVMAEEDGGLAYFDEVFVFPAPSQREPGHVGQMRAAALAIQRSDWRETIQKRKLALQTKRKRSTLRPENYYTCPIGESDLDSDEGTDTENTGNEDHSEHPESCSVSSDLPKSESSCLGVHDTFRASTDVSSSLPTVNSDVNSPFTSQRDERGLCGGGEQTPSPQSALNKWDTEQEEMGTEINMWKLRSNRVEQIVSPLNKEIAQFQMSKRAGLEFNLGFGPEQNNSVDSLTNGVLLEIAKFALAINSSQKEFIMEILEYNFDFGLQSRNQRNTFTREIMKKVRQLRCCEDAVKFSNEVFELPGPRPSINMANQSEGNVIPQLSSVLKMEKSDVGFSSSADSHGESKEPIPHKSEDLYPFCKEIGLKLRVNHSQPNRKLEINVLTNGAMTEVTNFAEKLCGTFEEICLDILRHNFDLDLQSGDSDAAKNILARIPVLVEQKNLSASCAKGNHGKKKGIRCLDFKNNPNLDTCSSPDIERKKEINLKLWKVRTKQIQHMLSMPHKEDCPLYSYSRCKKVGIDFNVGSGVKQNLDPKFLTNGIMAELNAFVVALLSSTKHFITEILEFNFNLDLKDELHRSAFTQEIVARIDSIRYLKKGSETRRKIPFKLPDMSCIQEPFFDRTTYCPRCYQERNHKLGQDESDAGHVNPCLQSMTDTVSANENYSTKKPAKDTSSTFSAIEETIMNCNLRCKKIGLTLCVDKHQPTIKLDTHLLTCGVVMEVENFAKKLCGTRVKILHDLLEHNFNISMQQTRLIDFGKMHRRVMAEEDGGLAYFDEVFVFPARSQREPGHVGQMSAATLATQRSDWRETIQKRKIALQTKEERATLPNPNKSVVKSTRNQGRKRNLYPICTEIGLDLDVTSKSEEKEKLDLNLLTAAVVYEIHKFVTNNRSGHYFPGTLFDILDYNFDLSSQHHRRWEFAIAAASEVQNTLKRYRQNREQADKVFKLPFVFDPKKHTRYSRKESGKYICAQQELHLDSNEVTDSRNAGCQDHLQNPTSADTPRESNSSCHVICASLPTTADIFLALPAVNSNVNPLFESQSDERGLCTAEAQTQTAQIVACECDVKQKETKTENYYSCPIGESDIDSDAGADSQNTGNQDHFEHPESCSVNSDLLKSESSCLGVHDTFLTSTDVSSNLPTVNSDVNSPFTSQRDERGLCRGGEQKPSPQSALNKWDMEQEEIGMEINMWKLRSNRVEQIVSPLNKEFGLFHISKKLALEFNVGFGPKQNISVDSLTNSVLHKIAKFAIAINSSQKEFIMEILEYNFDLGVQSPNQRNTFTREIMKRVRQLRCCEDAVKFSNEVFELPGPRPSINMANQSEGNVIPQLSSVSRMEKRDVGFSSSADSHGESKEPIPHKSVDLYPFCKEIGLKLRVNNSKPNRKLEINVLTNGAMIEVTNFAEKLCGTFEEICLDILRHNFDLQSGDSDAAKNILARIPVLVEQNNLSAYCPDGRKMKKRGITCMDFMKSSNLNACSPGSSQAAMMDQNESSSADTEHKKEINLKLWKMRTKQIQHILSMPHEEHCPLYSFSRCKKVGIDFNVGSGVKQNLDPKFLTNGIMAELNAFVVALLSSTKHFITEILEFNFNLDLQDELHRSAFAEKVLRKLEAIHSRKKASEKWPIPFELPDMSYIQEPSFDRIAYCPRCYQERNHKLGQDESDAGHVNPCLQSMTDTVSADENYSTKKPAKDTSSTFSAIEETIMNCNPRCKKIGLTLCVDKDQPTDKLDTHLLTCGVMMEVEKFAQKLCGTRVKVFRDLLEHNFNISIQQTFINFGKMHRRRVMAEEDGGLAYFDEVFVFPAPSQREPGHVGQMSIAALATQRSDWRETIQKRKLALQTKEERATLPNPNKSVVKSKKNHGRKRNLYPICTEIGLDLDVTSKSEEKEKLDLNLLTAAVVYEIHKFITRNRSGHYFPGALFDILDYNFDLSSQHHRRWEFAMAAASEVQTILKQYRINRNLADKVCKLPLIFHPRASQSSVQEKGSMKRKRSSQDEPEKKRKKGWSQHQVSCSLDVNPVNFLCGPEPKRELSSHDKDTNCPTDPWMINAQSNQSPATVNYGSPLPLNIVIKEEEYDPYDAVMKTEPAAEEKYHPHYYNVKTESNSGDVGHLVPDESAGSLGYTHISMCPNTENVKTESENEVVQHYILAEPQGSQGLAMLAQYWVPVEVAASHGDSMIPVCQNNDSTSIKEEQENMLIDSYN